MSRRASRTQRCNAATESKTSTTPCAQSSKAFGGPPSLTEVRPNPRNGSTSPRRIGPGRTFAAGRVGSCTTRRHHRSRCTRSVPQPARLPGRRVGGSRGQGLQRPSAWPGSRFPPRRARGAAKAQAAFIGVGAMVGAGIFSLLGAAGEVAGAAAPLRSAALRCSQSRNGRLHRGASHRACRTSSPPTSLRISTIGAWSTPRSESVRLSSSRTRCSTPGSEPGGRILRWASGRATTHVSVKSWSGSRASGGNSGAGARELTDGSG